MTSNRANGITWIMPFNAQIKNNCPACFFCRQTESDRFFFSVECWRRIEWVWDFFVLVVFLGLGVLLVGWVFWCVRDRSYFL